MARTPKVGLDFFPLDVAFFEDPKVKKLRRKHGALGLSIFVNLLCRIYKEGYYLEVTDCEDLYSDIADQIFNDKQSREIPKIQQVILDIELCGLIKIIRFDNSEKQVLTSSGIQKQYTSIMEKSKRQNKVELYRLEDN